MACGICGGYYQCICDEKKMEEKIKNLSYLKMIIGSIKIIHTDILK